MASYSLRTRVPKKTIKKINISKKTGLPIVEKEESEEDDEEKELEPVENLGAKRDKNETAEEKRLRKQRVKEMKSVGNEVEIIV